MQRIIKQNINILFASKNECLICQIREIIEEFQINVRVVDCKDELLGLSRDSSYHVILLDLDLYQPEELDKVKKIIRDSVKPVVLISSYVSDQIPLDLVVYGAQDFIRKKDIYGTRIMLKMHLALARHQLRQELELERKKAKAESIQKSKFIGHLSHEIRNPLNSILGATELLNSTNLSSNQKDILQSLIASSSQLMMVVNDILDISKIEEGKIPLFIEPVLLKKMIDDFTKLCRYQLSLKGLDFNIKLADNLPKSISTDARRLKQILFNLVSNAIKFSDRGEIILSVCNFSESLIRFEVKDRGRGIPEAFIPQLFADYSQADEEDNKHGTGLGLSICKELVKLLGGRIGAHNNDDQGATFWFTIDRNLRIGDFQAKGVSALEDKSVRLKFSPRKRYANKKVLIVDDDSLNLKVLSKILSSFNASCECLHDGSEIMPIIDNLPDYSAIIIDCHMPKVNGIQVAKEIRKRGLTIPIIGLSGDINKEEDCIRAGMNSFLLKPISKDELAQSLILSSEKNS